MQQIDRITYETCFLKSCSTNNFITVLWKITIIIMLIKIIALDLILQLTIYIYIYHAHIYHFQIACCIFCHSEAHELYRFFPFKYNIYKW